MITGAIIIVIKVYCSKNTSKIIEKHLFRDKKLNSRKNSSENKMKRATKIRKSKNGDCRKRQVVRCCALSTYSCSTHM